MVFIGGVVSKNNEVVAVTILGAPHRWRAGRRSPSGVCRQCSWLGPLPFWLETIIGAALASPCVIFAPTMAQWGSSAGRFCNAAPGNHGVAIFSAVSAADMVAIRSAASIADFSGGRCANFSADIDRPTAASSVSPTG